MTAGAPLYVLDSFALLAFFQDEPAAGTVQDLLERGERGEIGLAMAVVNLGEVVYRTIRAFGHDRANDVLALISDYEIEMVPVDRELALPAARLKGSYKMSYADCIAAALAQRLNAVVVTGDPEFRSVEGVVRIEWLPMPDQR